MAERLYEDLAAWWPLLSPPETYDAEALVYLRLLRSAAEGPLRSLLELGAGGGHLASRMPADLTLTLVDRATSMVTASRRLNPDRRHVVADFRDMRLDERFDAVVLHDAVMYLTTPEDLGKAFATAFAHLRPGGAFLVIPDVVRETFVEGTIAGGGDDGLRAAQMLEWHWDPDPTDHTYRVDMTFLLREADGSVRSVHDVHTMGLFSRGTFWDRLRGAGFTPVEADPLDAVEVGELFLCRKPV